MTRPMTPRLVSSINAAIRCSMSRRNFMRVVNSLGIEGCKIGRKVLFTSQQLEMVKNRKSEVR